MDRFSKTIDSAKGLAILLVVLGHINSPFGVLIFSFHIPLFFFLAGIFIKTSYTGTVYLAKNINRLMVPFLIFGTLGLVVTILKNVLLHRPLESVYESLSGLLYWMDAPHMHHYGFILWFLPALFWGRVFVFISIKYLRLHPGFLTVGSIIIAWLTTLYITLPFGLDKALVALPWIVMGFVFYQYHERWLSTTWIGLVGCALLTALLVGFFGIQRLDLATKYIGNPFISFPYTLAVILLLVSLLYQCSNFYGGRVTALMIKFGQNTMLVMVLHVYTNNAADVLVNRVLGPGYWLITFLLSVSIVFVAIQMKQRYADSLVFKYL